MGLQTLKTYFPISTIALNQNSVEDEWRSADGVYRKLLLVMAKIDSMILENQLSEDSLGRVLEEILADSELSISPSDREFLIQRTRRYISLKDSKKK